MNALLVRLAMLIAVLGATSAIAAPATAAVAGDLAYTDLGATIRIDGCASGTCPASITIPATLTGKPVTSFQSAAFYNQTTLTSVSFATPSNLTSISDTAFRNTHLTSITIPQGVTSVGDDAFLNVSTLASVTLPASLAAIGSWAFSATGVTAVTLPASLAAMGTGAFSGTTALETLTFTAPSSLTAIPSSAFQQAGITTVSIPDGVTTIGVDAFRSCPRLTQVSIGLGTTTIGAQAFYNTPSLTSVAFPQDGNLTTLGTYAFASSGLLSVDIPDSVTSMGTNAFAGTSSLNNVAIGRGLTEIPQLAFFASGIRSISFASPSAVATINNQAFYGVANLGTITIPSSVAVIGPDAFKSATGLRSVTFAWPSAVTSLGSLTFRDASNLATIDFFGNAPTVAAGALSGTPSSLVIRYLSASTGWTAALDGRTTALAVPWTPATPTATAGDASAAVTTSVAYPSNAPSEITVTAAPGGQSCRISGASGTCTITGLTNDTAYTFTAVATSAAGASSASSASAPVTPSATAAAPSATAVAPERAAATLRVAEPRVSGQSLTTDVTVTGPGVIRQTATRIAAGKRSSTTICSAQRRTKKAGKVTITCVFDARIRAALRRNAIRVRVTTRFTPTNGKATVMTSTLTIPRAR